MSPARLVRASKQVTCRSVSNLSERERARLPAVTRRPTCPSRVRGTDMSVVPRRVFAQCPALRSDGSGPPRGPVGSGRSGTARVETSRSRTLQAARWRVSPRFEDAGLAELRDDASL